MLKSLLILHRQIVEKFCELSHAHDTNLNFYKNHHETVLLDFKFFAAFRILRFVRKFCDIF